MLQIKAIKSSFVCFNKECKLRKQKSCRGFEGCPGFKGKVFKLDPQPVPAYPQNASGESKYFLKFV